MNVRSAASEEPVFCLERDFHLRSFVICILRRISDAHFQVIPVLIYSREFRRDLIDDEIVSRCFIFSSRSIIRNIEDVFCLNFFIFIAKKKAVLRTVIFFCL